MKNPNIQFKTTIARCALAQPIFFLLLSLGLGAMGVPSSLGAPNTFSATGSLATARVGHTATLLPSGKVLVAGGLVPAPDGFCCNSFLPALSCMIRRRGVGAPPALSPPRAPFTRRRYCRMGTCWWQAGSATQQAASPAAPLPVRSCMIRRHLLVSFSTSPRA